MQLDKKNAPVSHGKKVVMWQRERESGSVKSVFMIIFFFLSLFMTSPLPTSNQRKMLYPLVVLVLSM